MSSNKFCAFCLSAVAALLTVSAMLALLLKARATFASSDGLYVAPGGDCGSVSPCYSTLQAAVDVAFDGDTIKAAQGVYTSSGFQVVYISKAITLTGGYTTTDWANSYPITQATVIDAENVARRRGIYIEETSATTITLAGLTIQRGNARNDNGGGVYIPAGSVILRDSRIFSNTASGDAPNGRGGGVYVGEGTLGVYDSTFVGNDATSFVGGALANRDGTVILNGNTFRSNSGSYGGAVSITGSGIVTMTNNDFQKNTGVWGTIWIGGGRVSISDNTFTDNNGRAVYADAGVAIIRANTFTSNNGGALYLLRGRVTVVDNDFIGNTAGQGGAVYCENYCEGTALLSGNFIKENSASYGGGMHFYRCCATMVGNTIISNTASTAGGGLGIVDSTVHGQNDVIAGNISPFEGIYLSTNSALDSQHWTLADNGSYAIASSSSSAVLTNTIVASHTVGGFSGSGVSADHTLFFNSGIPCSGGASCTNSLNGDPKFVNTNAGDYHIAQSSMAIDAGVDVGVTTDIDEEPRLGTPDLGADEYWAPGALKRVYLPLVLR